MPTQRSLHPAPKRDEVLTIRVPSDLASTLRALASANDDTVSRLVRQALRALAPTASTSAKAKPTKAVSGPVLTSAMADALRSAGQRIGVDVNTMISAAIDLMNARGAHVSTVTPDMRAAILPVISPVMGAPTPAKARTAAPAKALPVTRKATTAQPHVTRETLCRHLGLDPARATGGEIRRQASAVGSGSRLMNSSPERAAALRSHLGLATHCCDEAVKAIVWSLSSPPGTNVNPHIAKIK